MSSRSAISPGLSHTNPVMATILTILMFSLAGIPPLAGFFAKWYVFLAAIKAGLYALAVIGVVARVVGAYYYLRIIKIMWFDEPVGGFVPWRASCGSCSACPAPRAVLRPAWIGGPVSDNGGRRRQDLLLTRWPFRWPRRPSRTDTGSKRIDTCRLHQRRGAGAGAGGRSGKLWVVAKRQESGRGRRGRAWATPDGNLAATLLLVETYELKLAATLGFVAGLALADALDAVVPIRRIAHRARRRRESRRTVSSSNGRTMSWPTVPSSPAYCSNPTSLPDDRFALAIGIGVNVVAHPDDVPYPATSLRRSAPTAMPETLFSHCPMHGTRTAASGTRARAGRNSPALAFARRRAGSARSRFASTAMSCGACSRQSTRTAASLFAPAVATSSRSRRATCISVRSLPPAPN